MHFLALPMLWGLALASVPLIIHLLNRRRFQIVEWAPMKYLKLTIKNNRRRLRVEQLLLLLLRTFLIILLVVIVARPALSKAGFASWLSRRSRVSRIVVVDNSLAMDYRQEGKTALDQAKSAAEEVLRVTGTQDSITFLTTTPASTPLVREATLDDPSKLIAQVKALQATDAACNWANTFKVIDECVGTATFPEKEIILITDMRRSGWSGGVTELADRWAAAGIDARIIDVGSRKTANVSLPKFAQEDSICLPGMPLKLAAEVKNDTAETITGAQAVLTVDGQARPVVLPPLPPGALTDVPLSVTLDAPGQHQLDFALPDDALSGDNLRHLSIDVRERLDLTLVDGRQGAGPFESSGDFVQLALSVGQEPWHVQHWADTDLQASHPDRADALVITDASNLSAAAVAAYEKLVKDGAGLMIFCGEQVDPVLYNQRLFRNGAGLLPARLDRIEDGPVRGIVVEGFADSPLAPLAKLAPAALAKIESRRLMTVEVAKNDPATRVLARWNDSEGHPAVIERQFGKGRVLLFTTSADREWTDWPIDPTYVLAVRSAALSVARPDRGEDNLVAGHPLEYRPADDKPKLNARITAPGDQTPQLLASDADGFHFPHTERAGVYTLSWNDALGRQQTHKEAVSFDKNASDLEPLTELQLAELLGNLKASLVVYQPGALASAGPGREIWRNLAITLVCLLVVESLMAFYVGRER
jgi:hypothetical protein